jgi:formylglycine-generating enzyme required for sulfatase activity
MGRAAPVGHIAMRDLRLPTLAFVTVTGLATMALLQGFAAPPRDDGLVRIAETTVSYREPGEYLDGGRPLNGPVSVAFADEPLFIMKRQVLRAEYDRCVAAAACKALDDPQDGALPVVGTSYDDAVAYATWLSATSGERWRLPTDREWALAAASRYRDDALTEISDPANPARRWIAVYDAEAANEQEVDPRPMPVGSFGANEHGLLDLAGNVWEWTSTCYARHRTDPATGRETTVENCGVRIAEGRHRAYMTTFFRDPKAGACSVGVPPANLGLRLVRETGGLAGWIGL